jgi:carboxylate-amine ligase
MGALTVGVEEEFLLVDAMTGVTIPAAAILARTGPVIEMDVRVQMELVATQLETATGVR